MLEDLDLVLVGQLLEDVGEPLVVQRGDHGGPPLGRQVVDDAGGVGGAHLVQGRDQVGGALRGLAAHQPDDVAPLDDVGLAATAQALAPQPLARLLHGDPAQHPVAGARLLHRDVVDGAGDAALAALAGLDGDRAVEHLADHERLGRALLEPAHVQQPGGVDLPAVDVGDPGHRDEDPAAPEHLARPGRARVAGWSRSGWRPRGRAPCRPGRPGGRRWAGRPGVRRTRGPASPAPTGRCSQTSTLPSGRRGSRQLRGNYPRRARPV